MDIEQFDVEAVNSKENRVLYQSRQRIHPKRVNGTFRRFKWLVMLLTLGVYYLTPWLRWERGEGMPDQAVLLDLANQRFYFFFIEIWPHEFFYVAGMLVMAGIGLFLVTSILGRAWCGYTCPQTVWVDLFLVVERYIEGDRNARIKLDAAPWSISKTAKRLSKHLAWLVIAVATGGAWIFYFADAPSLLSDFMIGQAHYTAYATVAVLTATTYVFGGLMREQVCTYMCPWPRVQAAMLDENSLTVTYNDWRGEPRSKHAKRLRKEGKPIGDCVDCNACVAVCPMGIDIRKGQQMECITCALCIDACDHVMKKIGLEEGLISYATLRDYDANMAVATAGSLAPHAQINPSNVRNIEGYLSEKLAHFSWASMFRMRTLVYLGLYGAIGIGMLIVLAARDRLDVNVIADRNPLFTVLSDGSIRNGYELKILNMEGRERRFRISIEGLKGASLYRAGGRPALARTAQTSVAADKLKSVRLFVSASRDKLDSPSTNFTFKVEEIGGEETATVDAKFKAPSTNG